MENFISYNSTRLHFGKGVVKGLMNNLGAAAKEIGETALLVYGGGSVLRNGSYEDTLKQLKRNNIRVVEYSGIKPNPVVTDVDNATVLGLKENVDFVVAVGGGSVIDSAKIIAVCIADKVKGWDIMSGKHRPNAALPIIAVLTLAATGTEMNPTAVIQNHETNEKNGFRHPVMAPKHSFLDPTYTQSVPADYTAYGIVDLIAHSLEAWFGAGDAPLSDKYVISIIQEALEKGPELMKDLENYDLRARIMWAATNALNDITMHARKSGDWGVHGLGHVLSYLYDTAHGATLSIIYPAWLRHIGSRSPERIIELGKSLFSTDSVESTVVEFEKFFQELGSPIKASEVGLGKEKITEILDLMTKNRVSGMHHALDESDRKSIVELMMA